MNKGEKVIEIKRKNHWKKSEVDKATKKINNEIYKRNKQASIQIKLDDFSSYFNSRIQKRGLARGMVCIQEELNESLLKVSQRTVQILLSNDLYKQLYLFDEIDEISKVNIWTSIRFLMINRGLTPGEINELIKKQMAIDQMLNKWKASIESAISAKR